MLKERKNTMKNYSVFDILGPVMIGPSSSHTAGAARLGKVARGIAGEDFTGVTFYLHGSFAKTYRGHGTDRALAAGILGMETDDERLRDSLRIANELNINIEFIEADLGDMHPNTVKMVFHKNDGNTMEITGSSIGGGNIIITEINGDAVEFTGANPTVIVKQADVSGVISSVTAIIAGYGLNIASMHVTRKVKGKNALTIIEVDGQVTDDIIKKISGIDNILSVRLINPV
jgi:L-serine dehydratase